MDSNGLCKRSEVSYTSIHSKNVLRWDANEKSLAYDNVVDVNISGFQWRRLDPDNGSRCRCREFAVDGRSLMPCLRPSHLALPRDQRCMYQIFHEKPRVISQAQYNE